MKKAEFFELLAWIFAPLKSTTFYQELMNWSVIYSFGEWFIKMSARWKDIRKSVLIWLLSYKDKDVYKTAPKYFRIVIDLPMLILKGMTSLAYSWQHILCSIFIFVPNAIYIMIDQTNYGLMLLLIQLFYLATTLHYYHYYHTYEKM